MNVEKLKALWNKNADQYNQWDELGLDEIVAFAQQVEREACAKRCDELAENLKAVLRISHSFKDSSIEMLQAYQHASDAIRRREKYGTKDE